MTIKQRVNIFIDNYSYLIKKKDRDFFKEIIFELLEEYNNDIIEELKNRFNIITL